MQHTLVAVFDNRTDAQNAMNELLSSNFSRQDVRLSNADPTGMSDSVTGTNYTNTDADDEGRGIGASIKNFFTDVFGADDAKHASKYEGAVTRGHHVLTVMADSMAEVERAADIVERYGPSDIDEQASGADAAAGGMGGTPESMRMDGAGAMQQSNSAGMQSGGGVNQQLENAGDRKLFAQQSLNQAEPMGQTYQEPQGKSGLSATGGTSLQSTTLQENSVQGSALEGTQKSDTSFLSSGGQGGTLQGSTPTGAIQAPGSGLGADPVGSPTHSHLGSQQRDMSGQSRSGGADSARSDAVRTAALRSDAGQLEGTQTIPVVEEQLSVGKREVRRGGVRIYSRVVETPVNESISLREEHLDVQRRPVDRTLSDVEGAFREQSFEVRATSEEAVVEKSARIVEEVTLNKEVSERQEQIQDSVRHTEIDVQRLEGKAMSDLRDDDSYFRNHFDRTYGASGESYDDYAPAYSYGSQVARSGKYSGREWDQVEHDLQSDWDTRNSGGQSTWEKMKASVRHGWDSVRNDDDDDDDKHYRSHYEANLKDSGMDYDKVKPAYEYGAEARRSQMYRLRPYDDVEGSLARGWDSRIIATHPGAPGTRPDADTGHSEGGTWDRIKSAVRHGWDRVSDDDDNRSENRSDIRSENRSDDDNDRAYRSHWNATYSKSSDAGNFEDFKPAYAYGTAMAEDPKYRGRQWNDSENDLRNDWESRYGSGDQSTWEKMKSAVRHGWDRVTS